jgi:hypothetical protein
LHPSTADGGGGDPRYAWGGMRARVALVGLALAVAAVTGVCFRAYERDERVTMFYVELEQRLRAGVLAGLTEGEARAYLDAQDIPCRPPTTPGHLVCRSGNVAPGRLIGSELVVSLELDQGGRVVRTQVQRSNT